MPCPYGGGALLLGDHFQGIDVVNHVPDLFPGQRIAQGGHSGAGNTVLDEVVPGLFKVQGHVNHQAKELRYVYTPTRPRAEARRGAVSRLVQTFFDGSAASAIAGMLSMSEDQLDEDELDRLADAIESARKKGDRR